jgi:hypothetical protein
MVLAKARGQLHVEQKVKLGLLSNTSTLECHLINSLN